MGTKGRTTQRLANAYPPWASIRKDEQSQGWQILNVIGKRLDDLRKQSAQIYNNFYISTSVVSDIDVYYQYKLPGDYEFVKEDDDDTEFIYTPPSVSGVIDGTVYSIPVASGNDIESFWYNIVPSRLSLSETVDEPYLVASGYVQYSPFDPLVSSGLLHSENQLTISLSGGTSYLELQDNNQVRRGIVQIHGETREGTPVSEELIFLHDETRKTIYDYKLVNVSGIRVYGINEPDEAFLNVRSAGFNLPDYPINYQLDVTVDRDDMPLFWALGSGVNPDTRTLDLMKYEADDLELRLEGYVGKWAFLQQELLDTSGNNIVPIDIAVEPFSDRIWVASSGMLYVYSAELPYPDLTALSGKDYDANCVIEPNTYYAVIGDEIELDYIWANPTVGLVAHRVFVEKPDGSQYNLEGGVETTYNTDTTSWDFGEPATRRIRPSEIYTLDQRGDYIYTLQALYTDGTTSIDKRIISVRSLQPLGEYSTTSLLGAEVLVSGVDFDSEYKLWVLDNDGITYQLDRHWDVYMIDFSKKNMYFRESYDQIRTY